ncbi:ABC transporter ATP-binding protein [Pseudoalteromonas lipolytica]|uniref:ABC transporter ATP-binding protein n=1 Tax=Pseudoalteromonas lipolytica TaxID=570156 RepID=A0ABU8T036_9GAMM
MSVHLSESPPAIELRGVYFHYDKQEQESTLSIKDLAVQTAEQVFLYGDSGSGKTTLLNLLSGVAVPSKGEILLFGQPFSKLSSRKRDKFRARHIGVVFQQFNLIPYLSVLKNIQLASYFAKKNKGDIENWAIDILLGLKLPLEVLHKRAESLSVGQQQRVAIARALINQPEILLVDEPTSALDISARDAFITMLTEICLQLNTTLIFVSHDMNLKSFFRTSIDISEIKTTGVHHVN